MFSLLNGKAGDIVTTAYTLACARTKEAMLSGEAFRWKRPGNEGVKNKSTQCFVIGEVSQCIQIML